MTIWERLGIPPTHDVKAIKRAYAEQLKIHHPEDDPQGYQALREAFDAALSLAKRQAIREEAAAEAEDILHLQLQSEEDKERPLVPPESLLFQARSVEFPEEDEDAEALEPPPKWPPHMNVDAENASQRSPRTIADLIAAVNALYDHFPSRISPDKWIELLNSEVMWNIEYKLEISKELLAVLQNRRYLPAGIWKLLESYFHWEEYMRESPAFDWDRGVQSFFGYYVRQLREPGLGYGALLHAGEIDIDAFLENRDQGYLALFHNDLNQAEKHLKLAYSLFPADPDLLRMLGEYYLRLREYSSALACYNHLIKLQPSKISHYLYRALTWYNMGNYEYSAKECVSLVTSYPDHYEAMILLGYSLKEEGLKEKGLHWFRKVLEKTDKNERSHHKYRKQALNGIFYIDIELPIPYLNHENFESDYNINLQSSTVQESEESLLSQRSPRTIADLIAAVTALYDHFPSRISPDKWIELLNSEVMWNIEYKLEISKELLAVLQNRRYLPAGIWKLLESYFHWEEYMRESPAFDWDRGVQSFFGYYVRQLREPGLGYGALLHAGEIDIDAFLENRDQGYLALFHNDLNQAEKHLKLAYSLFPADPDLLRMLGEYYLRLREHEKALSYVDHLILLMPDELDAQLRRAQIFYDSGQFSRSLEECELIISRNPDHYEAWILSGQNHKALGDQPHAEEQFHHAQQMGKPSSQEHKPKKKVKPGRLFFRKRILAHVLIWIISSVSLIGCYHFYGYSTSLMKPVPAGNIQALERMKEQRYTSLTLTKLKDTGIGKYKLGSGEGEGEGEDAYVYQNQAYAFRHFVEYGDAAGYFYLGEFDGYNMIVLSAARLDLENMQHKTTVLGYVHPASKELQADVIEMLQWKPEHPEGTPEAELELYTKSLIKHLKLFQFGSKTKPITKPVKLEIFSKYIEVRAPIKNTETYRNLLAAFIVVALAWLYSSYILITEFRSNYRMIRFYQRKGMQT
ncbi:MULTISPECIES: J domain-containing protein [Paenibacillus]|uniref:J domain-containing protein n=1 Tax=Paenibacillus albilobatus TaxID=2716884 RepID=A0A919XF14_9BACL|nr:MULTISPECIES: J domain-containing protein [Paenibacillus]GIO31551.1 hypothetical protein J2TS6_26920 [Paenibacillus albilobatus]